MSFNQIPLIKLGHTDILNRINVEITEHIKADPLNLKMAPIKDLVLLEDGNEMSRGVAISEQEDTVPVYVTNPIQSHLSPDCEQTELDMSELIAEQMNRNGWKLRVPYKEKRQKCIKDVRHVVV